MELAKLNVHFDTEVRMSIPIGTFLAKVQYADSKGILSHAKIDSDDAANPFHFAALKKTVKKETDEVMLFTISPMKDLKPICGAFHTLYSDYVRLFGEKPEYIDSKGFRAVFKSNDVWESIFMIITPFKFPVSFLYSLINQISYGLAAFFKPTQKKNAARFVQKSLIAFSKNMNCLTGYQSIITGLNSQRNAKRKPLDQTDSMIGDSGLSAYIADSISGDIHSKCSIYVFGRLIYSTMDDNDLALSEMLVANMSKTTEDHTSVAGDTFCLARHYNTVMVSIIDRGSSMSPLERCCNMQASLMRLDAKNMINKMQHAFARILPPEGTLDALVVYDGRFKASQPPFRCAPLFANPNPSLSATALASLLYETISSVATNAIINLSLSRELHFRICYRSIGNGMHFWIAPKVNADKIGNTNELDRAVSLLGAVSSGTAGR